MKPSNLVTIKQAEALASLGFHEPCAHYVWRKTPVYVYTGVYIDWNNSLNHSYLAIPDVDQAIDWLRKKHHVIIYHSHAPFVNPQLNNAICYTFSIKRCDKQWGWNQRKSFGRTKMSKNIYSAKRMAITIALRGVLGPKSKKE